MPEPGVPVWPSPRRELSEPVAARVAVMGLYVVTGATRGVGALVTLRLQAAGHEVIGVVRPGSVAPSHLRWKADLSRPATLAAAIGEQASALDRLDGVVHCAGVVDPGPLADATPEDFEHQLGVNVVAVAELTRLVLPALRAARGTVVLVNSGSGLTARPPLAVYGVSKHALRGYADALRAEESRLRVSTLFPGRTDTDMQRTVRAAEGGDYQPEAYLRPETVAQVICSILELPADAVITDLTLRPRG